MKTWCIIFERELDGKETTHLKSNNKPTNEDIINHIKNEGYGFNEGYDEIREVYEV